MKQYIPSYYRNFQCIAQKCKDNCCIGWDIMIDQQSYEQYQKVATPFKKRLNEGIIQEEEPKFYMNEDGRCAFLNENNLCDIYIQLGEEALCDICTEHPRFHNEYGHIVQSGLGLACEEAARLILNDLDLKIEEDVLKSEKEDDEWANELMKLEMLLLNILKNKEYCVDEKIDKIFDLTAAYQKEINYTGELTVPIDQKKIKPQHLMLKMRQKDYLEYWFDFYSNLDYMDETFQSLLRKSVKEFETCKKQDINDQYIERLLYYFIYRHFIKAYEDDNLIDKIKFAVLSVLMIEIVAKYCKVYDSSFELLDIAKMYSKEMKDNEHESLVYDDGTEGDFIEDPRDNYLQMIDLDSLKYNLSRMKRRHRDTLLFRYVYGLKCKEIADIFKISERTVKIRCSEARVQLKKMMEEDEL